MDKYFRKNMIEELARRARLSMTGKAVIGVIGGIMVLIVGLLRTCNEREPLDTPNVQWFNHEVITLATTLDVNKRIAHFSQLGLDRSIADSVASFIASGNVGGAIVHELSNKETDSLNNKCRLSIPGVLNPWQVNFYVNSLKNTDYVVVVNDSLIESIIVIPE